MASVPKCVLLAQRSMFLLSYPLPKRSCIGPALKVMVSFPAPVKIEGFSVGNPLQSGLGFQVVPRLDQGVLGVVSRFPEDVVVDDGRLDRAHPVPVPLEPTESAAF